MIATPAQRAACRNFGIREQLDLGQCHGIVVESRSSPGARDAKFIASASVAIPSLLAYADECDAEIARLKAQLAEMTEARDEANQFAGRAINEETLRARITSRVPGCVCAWEHGDSRCPKHPTCAECGCVTCECKEVNHG